MNPIDQFHNQFVTGGLVLMFTGSLIALAKDVPRRLWDWIKRRCTVDVRVENSDPLFDYITYWLDSQPYSKKSRTLSASTATRINIENDGKKLKVIFSPAPGTHYFFYDKKLLQLTRTKDSNAAPVGVEKTGNLRKEEYYVITVVGKNQNTIRQLMEEIVEFGSKPTDLIKVHCAPFGYWQSRGSFNPRKLDSVILPIGLTEKILEDAKKFLGSQDWYKSIGIPWHRGYLFSGVPGSGKTSLVSALAGELNMDIYLLNLAGRGMSDDKLEDLIGDVRPGSIVLMEDIDCVVPDREKKDDKGVTLAGLLNCLDGINSQEGCMVFMTTNYKEKLDSALIRPGRVDFQIEFGYATEDQIRRMYKRILQEDPQDVSSFTGLSMAIVQQRLLEKLDEKEKSTPTPVGV